jgi:hypothetical protein
MVGDGLGKAGTYVTMSIQQGPQIWHNTDLPSPKWDIYFLFFFFENKNFKEEVTKDMENLRKKNQTETQSTMEEHFTRLEQVEDKNLRIQR